MSGQYRTLGTNRHPSFVLAGAAQLTIGTSHTPRAYCGNHNRKVCFLYPKKNRLWPVLSVRAPRAARFAA